MNPVRAVVARRLGFAVVALTLAAPAAFAETSTVALNTTTAAKVAALRIDNFGVVSPTYFRGSMPDRRDLQDLKALGVKTVIDLTSDDGEAGEQAMVEKSGMRFVKIPMTTRTIPTADQMAQFLSLVNDSSAQPVYVHCIGGRHRTGVMTALYRMTQEGWTGERAFAEMKDFKFGADFLHPEFKKFVLAYKGDDRVTAPILATAVSTVQ